MYWLFVIGGIGLTLGLNMIFDFSWQTFLDFLFVFIIILLPSIISLLFQVVFPKKWLDGKAKIFQQKKFEKNLYRKIGVKNWKDKVPNCGNVGKGVVNENNINLDEKNINYFVYQTCLGEIVHKFCIATCLISTILLGIFRFDLFFKMVLPVWFVYTTINILSIIIQRYNRPRLNIMLAKIQRANRSKAANDNENNAKKE